LVGFLEIFDGCPGGTWFVSWRYMMGAWRYLMGVLKLFIVCPGDI